MTGEIWSLIGLNLLVMITLMTVIAVPSFTSRDPSYVGPLAISTLVMKWSGVGPLERQLRHTKPGYLDYVSRTSTFFPRPPKRVEVAA